MNELSEKELFQVRLRFIDLLKSFFQEEPDAEKMSRWRGIFSALADEQINPLFDSGVRELCSLLNSRSLADLKDEYYRLFVDPFSDSQIVTLASYYLDGRSFGESLVELRGLLGEAGLEKTAGVVDSEDSVVMMLDTFGSLIDEDKKSGSALTRQLQVRLLTEFLEPFSVKFSAAVEKSEKAVFYKSCCKLLRGYLDLEKGLVTVA